MPGHRKRRQFKQTDAFTRGMVIGLKRAGWSIRQIAADTHLGASTVHRLWRRWLEQGNVAIYRNVGATRVTSARVDRRILRQAVAAPQATCTAILQHVQDTLDHSISTRTISRRLVANGLHSCRPLRRLPLTPPNRRQRLEWCRARSTWMTEWHRVVFSDESRFCLFSDSRRVRVWRRRGERSNPAAIVERPTVRQRGIMVWGAIAYDSRSPLLRIQGTMTAQRYVDDVLRPVTLPYLQGVPNALYQQDNARPHTARISQQALQDVQMLPWPPYSPDLSPIEHVWDIIGRRLHAIPQDAIRTLIDSLPRRVAACITVRGFEVLEHPAYSPDLAPSDYFLFGLLKKELKGKRFDLDEDVQKVVQDIFHTLPKSAYKEGIYKLPERWRRCIESQGVPINKKPSTQLFRMIRRQAPPIITGTWPEAVYSPGAISIYKVVSERMPGHRKRRQFKQTDAFTRGMVIGLKRAGWSIRQIAADTHLGASTVHRLSRRWLEQGNVAIYRNVGATRVTSARVDRRILRQAVAAPQATCTAILQHVQDTLDHSISTRTISRRLVANGLHSCRPLRRLPLTPPNRRQRLEWCQARSTWMTEWHRVVFSDESRFCLFSDSRRVRVWRRRGERSNPAAIVERPTVRQRGIMVWGAIAYDSRSPLLRIQGTMTAQRYVDDVLRPVTLPYLQGVPNALYQQDNARPHTARISQQALQDVQMLPWPPYSPDLSPIEHVWDIIGRRLHALPQPRSEDELWQMVEREWRAIPQDAIRTLIDSLPRRVAACITVRGGPTCYQADAVLALYYDYHFEINITYYQKLNRIRVSKALLKRYEEEGDHFLDQIVNGDEIWCYHYDPFDKTCIYGMETRRLSKTKKKKIRSQRSAGKVLLTIFWVVDGPICLDFLSSRHSNVNKLKPGIRNKRIGKLSKGVLFLHDNARPHTSCKTVSTIIKLGFEVLEHPAYSPDLAPSDYFLFGLLKKELKGKRFDLDEDVQKVVQDIFHTLPKSAYKEGIYKLPERWRRCIESQ
ncbi:hypothetical protein LAZ67_17000620, partial [Cordylochernes scorpioides]